VVRNAHVKEDTENFRSKIREEARIENASEFLYVIRRLKKVTDIKAITDMCLFKAGIEPMWEDPNNIDGGKWMIKIRRDTIDQRLVEKLLVWMGTVPFETMEVNGVVVSVRGYQTIMSLWTKRCPNKEEKAAQEKEIREMLGIKTSIGVTFKGNEESLKDKLRFSTTVKEKV